MSKSNVSFDRWKPREKSSWPFQVFNRYNQELYKIFLSHDSSSKYVYSTLGKASAEWGDDVEKHFSFDSKNTATLYSNLKDWSDSFNQFDNWVNLNAIIASISNLETYLASVIALALESDPGLLFGTSKVIDGVSLLKSGSAKFSFEQQIVICTKGDWQSRASAYTSIFGKVPDIIINKLSDLEKIRNIRNKTGHAFGRDIDAARKHGVKEILPMEHLPREQSLRYQRLLWAVAKSIDVHLFFTHIGEYQVIRFYHDLYSQLRKDVHPSDRAIILKKELGKFKAVPPGKLFCKQLVKYYEGLG